MKKFIVIFFGLCIQLSCTTSTQHVKEERLQDEKNTTDILRKIPSKFSGTIAAYNCDSIAIEVDLQATQFMLTLKYMGIGPDKRDSVFYENGQWQINGVNELNLISGTLDPVFSKYKIISEDHIMLLDSTGSEKTDGTRYILTLMKDNNDANGG